MAHLSTYVVLPAPPGSPVQHVILGPEDDVPEWAVPLIGDHCYADNGEADEPKKPAAKKAANRPSKPTD